MIALLAFVLPALAATPDPLTIEWFMAAEPTAAEIDAAVASAVEGGEATATIIDLRNDTANLWHFLTDPDTALDITTRDRLTRAWSAATKAVEALLRAGTSFDVLLFVLPGSYHVGPGGFYYDTPSTAGNGGSGGDDDNGDGGGDGGGGDGTADGSGSCTWDHSTDTGDPEWDDPTGIFAENEVWFAPDATLSVLAIQGDTVWMGTMRMADVAVVIGCAP